MVHGPGQWDNGRLRRAKSHTEDDMAGHGHIGAEQGRGPCVVCGSTGDGECSARMRTATPGGPRDRYDTARAVGCWMDRERPVPLEVNADGGRPDGWG